ncbi:hypothetical protein Q8F55_004343 [Vanrija albida]|uniref:Uncharacterized protein n=1 Tax=Vanrija albida TaxID=181172 RepID=A0ABR3Q6G5_9TREE
MLLPQAAWRALLLLFLLSVLLFAAPTSAQDLAITSPNASSVWATSGLQLVTYTGIPPGTDLRANGTLSLLRTGSAYTNSSSYPLRSSDWDVYDGAVVIDTRAIGIGASPLASGALSPAQVAGFRPGGGYQVLLELGGHRALSAPFLVAASGSKWSLQAVLPKLGAKWDVAGPITVEVVISEPANITVAHALAISGTEHWFHPLPGQPQNYRSLLDATGSWNRTRTLTWNITADWLRVYTSANQHGGVTQQATHIALYNARRGLEGDKWDGDSEMNASVVNRTVGNATRLDQSVEFLVVNAAAPLGVSVVAVILAAAMAVVTTTAMPT